MIMEFKEPYSPQQQNFIIFLRQETLRIENHYFLEFQNDHLTVKQKIINKEALYSLMELQGVLKTQNSHPSISDLEKFLTKRFARVQKSILSYTAIPREPMTHLCISIALHLENVRGSHFFKYLLPTLEYDQDQTHLLGNLGDFSLEEIIISDDLKSIIPAKIIRWIHHGEERLIRPYEPASQNHLTQLTEKEKQRLIEHSVQSERFIEISNRLTAAKLNDSSLGGVLQRLSQWLKKGSSHGGKGTSLNASQEAIVGVEDFFIYWGAIPNEQQEIYLSYRASSQGLSLKDILDVLSGKKDGCTYEMSTEIDSIVQKFKQQLFRCNIHSVSTLQSQYESLSESLENPEGSEKYYSLSDEVIQLYCDEIDQIKLSEFSNAVKDFDIETLRKIYLRVKHKIMYNFNDFFADLFQNSPEQVKIIFSTLCDTVATSCDIFKNLLPHLPQDFLLAAFDGLISQGIAPEIYSKLLSKLAREKFNSASHLTILIKVICSSLDFKLIMTHLSTDQQECLFENYQSQLIKIINNTEDMLNVLQSLHSKLSVKIYESFKSSISSLVKSAAELGSVLNFFPVEQFKHYILQNKENNWTKFILSPTDFYDFIKLFSDEQREFILENFALNELKSTAVDFAKIIKLFSRNQKSIIYEKYQLYLLSIVNTGNDFIKLVQSFHEKERELFLNLSYLKLIKLIDSGRVLGGILSLLSFNRCAELCKKLCGDLPNIILDGQDLRKLLPIGLEKIRMLYPYILRHLPKIIRTDADLINLIKNNNQYCDIIINILDLQLIQIVQENPTFKIPHLRNLDLAASRALNRYIEKKVAIFMRIYNALYVGQSSFFKRNFIIKLQGYNSLEKLMKIILHISNNPHSRSAKAWMLSNEIKGSYISLDKDAYLFKEIYLYSFKKSSFYGCSKIIPGMTLFATSKLEKYLKESPIKLDAIDPNIGMRRSKILKALG